MHPDTTDNTPNEIAPLPAEIGQVPDEIDQIYRTKQLARRLNVHPISICRWRKVDPTFPRPIRLGKQAHGYSGKEINVWLASRRLT